MKTIFRSAALILFVLIGVQSISQEQSDELIQFSGMVVTEEGDQLIPVPLCNIFLTGEGGRSTYSNLEGFFSVVAKKGENVVFSGVGYRTIEYVIPDTLEGNRYSIFQMMTKDTFLLPETVVYPFIPSREHFKEEFLALEVPNELEDIAQENLSPEKMEQLQKTTVRSGSENSSFYLRQQAQSYYYYGQAPPQNIFNPIAWQKFIQAWKNGDFKKKDK